MASSTANLDPPGPSTLQALPTEILTRIISFMDPMTEIRPLRRFRMAVLDTNISFLADMIDEQLAEQQCELQNTVLDNDFYWGGSRGDFDEICEINEKFVGMEFVSEQEDIEGDKWVSPVFISLPRQMRSRDLLGL